MACRNKFCVLDLLWSCVPASRMVPIPPFLPPMLSRALHSKISQHPTKTSPLVGPAVRLLLDQYDIKTSGLRASGPKKNILKGDVLSHINDRKLSPAKSFTVELSTKIRINNELVAEASHPIIPRKLLGRSEPIHRHDHVDIQLSELCQSTTKRFVQSKNLIPHAYASAHVSASKIMELLNRLSERTELKLSLNDFIVKACSMALRSVPELNVQYRDAFIHRISSVDLSVLLATPKGIVSPILFNAEQLTLLQISDRFRDFAARAREGQLRPEESKGGTFTISNLGMFDSVSDFTAVISPPQAAILTIGSLRRYFESGKTMSKPKLVSQFGATLCYDARTIEGKMARRFLDSFKTSLSSPETLVVGLEHIFAKDDEINEIDEGLEDEIGVGKEDEELAKLLFR